MLPTENQYPFKVKFAAKIKQEQEETGEEIVNLLLDHNRAMERVGDSIWNYFPSMDAYYQFTYRNKDAIQRALSDLVDSDSESTIDDPNSPYIEGGTFLGGGSDLRREMRSDESLIREEDREFIRTCLDALTAELTTTKSESARESVLRKYTDVITKGRTPPKEEP